LLISFDLGWILFLTTSH